MADGQAEVTLSEACEHIEALTGVRPHYSTVRGWCHRQMPTTGGMRSLPHHMKKLAGRTLIVVRLSDLETFVRSLLPRQGPEIGRKRGTHARNSV